MSRLVLLALLVLPGTALADDVMVAVDGIVNEGADASSLIETAAVRMRSGDLEGAVVLLDQLDPDDLPQNLQVEAAYQRANVEALRRRYPAALGQYQAILDSWPESHRALDAQFRVAELSGVLGEPKQAAKAMRKLAKADGLEPADIAKIDFNRAIFILESGKRGKGRRQVARALSRHESGLVAYYEAKAWVSLVEAELDVLDAQEVSGSKKRMAKTLGQRIGGLKAADEVLRETVQLKEPEWILAGLIRLAASWEELGDDILAAEEPELTPAQLRIYREELRKQAEGFWMRGLNYLEAGVDVGERLAIESARVETVGEARARLMRKIEG